MPATSLRKAASRLPVCVCLLIGLAGTAFAQLPTADLHKIAPHGAPAGTTLTVTIKGTDLDGADGLLFDRPGLTAAPVMLPADDVHPQPRPKANTFTLTIAADAAPGIYEARSTGRFGISTPRAFVVSPANTTEVTTPAAAVTKENALVIEPGQVVNGNAVANQYHWFRISAKKGELLRIRCDAEFIDSKMDANLVLHDANGKELDRNRDRHGRDPIIDVAVPADGDYLVALHDFLFLGGDTYFYRLSIERGPQVDAAFPPLISTQHPTTVTPIGPGYPANTPPVNLPPFKPEPPAAAAPAFSASGPGSLSLLLTRFQAPTASANPSSEPLLVVTENPIVREDKAATDSPAGQKVAVPCAVGGRFDEPDDTDGYRFTAKKGSTYHVEVIGARLGRAMDPYVVIEKVTRNAEGVESYAAVRELDDLTFGPATDVALRFSTRDPSTSFAADQDGDYKVTVIDQFGGGGPQHIYALQVQELGPDFSLLGISRRPYLDVRQVYAASPLLRRGGSFGLRVVVARRGGFDAPIILTASGLPAGVTAPAVTIPPNADSAVFVLHAAADAAPWNGHIDIAGTAKVGDAEFRHSVRIAAPVWPVANNTTERLRLRPWTRIPLAVTDAEPAPVQLAVSEPGGKPFSVTIGEKLEIPVKLEAKGAIKGNLAVQPFGLQGYIKPVAVQIADKANDGKVVINFAPSKDHKVAEGTYHFVLKGTGTLGKYVTDPPALEQATKENTRLAALFKQVTADAAKSKKDEATAKAALDKATAAANAAKPEAKAAADAALATAQAAHKGAQEANTAVAAKLKLTDTANKAAAATLKTATARSKERDVKFTVYSLPIRVEVKPKPEPEPAKK